MTIALSVFLVQVDNMVPEADTELAEFKRLHAIKQASMDFGRDVPDEITEDVSGDGGKFYPIAANLTKWDDGLSHIGTIQYPAPTVASDETPVYLEAEDWDDNYYASGVRYLWLPSHAPAATETMRITYSAPYTWSTGSSTTAVAQTGHGFSVADYVYQNAAGTWLDAGVNVNLLATHKVTAVADADNFTATNLVVDLPPADFFAVCNRAACLICQAIAERYSRTSDSTISADSVNHTSRAGEFASRAREFCRLYAEHVGVAAGDDGAATAQGHAEFVELDTAPTWPAGREFIFHGRHTR